MLEVEETVVRIEVFMAMSCSQKANLVGSGWWLKEKNGQTRIQWVPSWRRQLMADRIGQRDLDRAGDRPRR